MRSKLQAWMGLILMFSSVTRLHAQSCDAELVNALKTDHSERTSTDVVQLIRQAACESHDKGTLITIPYASYSSTDVGKACSSNDYQFFLSHRQDLATSLLPDRAFETIESLCRSTGLSATAKRTAGSVDLAVNWGGAAGVPSVKIKGVRWTNNVQSCAGELIRRQGKPEPVLKVSVGMSALCLLKDGDTSDGFITVATDHGNAVAKIFGQHHYELLAYAADDYLTCSLDDTEILRLPTTWPALQKPKTLNLDPLLTRRGDHVLQCKDVEIIGMDGHPCWKYQYEVKRDGQLLISQADYSCSVGTPAQPPATPPLTINIQ